MTHERRGRGTIIEQEIASQPAVIQIFLDEERAQCERLAQRLAGTFDYVVIAARGTSDNAARYAKYLFGAYNGLPVALATPSLSTLYQRPPKLNRALVVGISQSGQSPDVVSVLKEAADQGQPTLAITNDPASPLARASQEMIELHCGEERAVGATKTYTASLAALALLSAQLSGDRQRLEALSALPGWMEQVLSSTQYFREGTDRYRFIDHCAVIGRGMNYGTAFEVSLKIKELARVLAEPYSSADFMHGPIAALERGFPVLLIATQGAVLRDMLALAQRLTEEGAELLAISDQPELLAKATLGMPVPEGIPEWLSPLATVLPGQAFAVSLALSKGLDPDKPEGLQKVTETW
jgi:glucosamine--fructose-6-phosphate aminotransferase (isomerizing)